MSPAQRSGTEYPARKRVKRAGAFQPDHRAAVDGDRLHPPRLERDLGQRPQQRLFAGKALSHPLGREPLDLRLDPLRELVQRVVARHRRQHLQAQPAAARLDPPLSCPWPGRAKLGSNA